MSERIEICRHDITIAWGDMDALGHVNNVKYFDYCQEARIIALRAMNFDLLGETGPILMNASCTFLKPIVYPATITVTVSMHSLGQSSFMLDYDISQSEQLMAKGSSKIVWINYSKGKSIPLPEAVVDYYKSLSEAAS